MKKRKDGMDMRKTWKQMISTGCVVCVLASTFSVNGMGFINTQAEEAAEQMIESGTENGFSWSVNEDDTICITGYTGMEQSLEVPSEINGKAVTRIADSTFMGHEELTEIKFPAGIVYMGRAMFAGCSCLKSITLGDISFSIVNDSDFCILGKGDVSEVYKPEESWAMSMEGVLNAVFGQNFDELKKLKVDNDISGLEKIGLFEKLINLDEIELGSNSNYILEDGVLFNKDKTVIFSDIGERNEYTVPATVKKIEKNALAGSGLSTVIVAASVEEIEENAFGDIVNVIFEDGSHLKKLGDIFGSNISNLDMLKETKELESVDLGNNSLTDISALEVLPCLKEVYMSSSKVPQEYISEHVEYQVTLFLGEKLKDSYDITKCQTNKIPLKGRDRYGTRIFVCKDENGNIPTNLLKENGVANQIGSESLFYSTSAYHCSESPYEGISNVSYKVPVKITVVGWNAEEPLENNETMNFVIYSNRVGRIYHHPVIKDKNNNLWSIQENEDSFNVNRKATDIKEYVSDIIYYSPLYERQDNVLYLTNDNTLYSDDQEVAQNVIKYDNFYALTENGELKNMSGETVLSGIQDFVATYYEDGYEYTYMYLILNKNQELKSFVQGNENELTLIDNQVLKLQQGWDYEENGTDTVSGFMSYLKENGDLYGGYFEQGKIKDIKCYLIDSEIADSFSYRVAKKTDGSILYYSDTEEDTGIVTLTEKQAIFEKEDFIVEAYDTTCESNFYNKKNAHGILQEMLFVDSQNKVWGFDSEGNKKLLSDDFERYETGGFLIQSGKRYLYENGEVADYYIEKDRYNRLRVKDNILYINDVKVMTGVSDAEEMAGDSDTKEMTGYGNRILFVRVDGSIWVLDYTENQEENSVPKKIFSFIQEDKETGVGITMEDGTPLDGAISLKVSDVTQNQDYNSYIEAVKELGDSAKLFDISLMKEGVAVQPSGNIRVSIPLPEGMSERAKIYHIAADGNVTDMNAEYADGKLSFVTDHFSVYAVVDENSIPGDVDGDGVFNMKDAALVRRYIAKWPVTINETAADVNKDGKINMLDYALMRRAIAKWDVELQ